MIIRARAVITMDGPPIENGAVFIEGAKIAAVGRWSDLQGEAAGREVVDLGECALLPGLINAHCHLDYTALRGRMPRPASFTGWIAQINGAKAALTPDDYVQSIRAGLREAAGFGTTTIANLEAFPGLIEQVAGSPPLRVWWFAELIDVRAPVDAGAISVRLEKHGAQSRGGVGLAPHAPFTASVELYSRVAEQARTRGWRATTHLAESREEMEMFRDAGGALFDFMKSIGRPMGDCGGETPVAVLLGARVLDERWIAVHVNELTANDLLLLESAPRFHIAHCPRSHDYFGHSPFRYDELRARGFNVCVGTDSLASNGDLSLLAELRQFQHTHPALSPHELLATITLNAAAALGQEDALGKARAGFCADLIAVPWHGHLEHLLDEVIAYDEKIPWLMLGGTISVL